MHSSRYNMQRDGPLIYGIEGQVEHNEEEKVCGGGLTHPLLCLG